MSFSVDLWNGLNIIKNEFVSTLNKIYNISDVLLSYANYQKAHSKNLEILYKDNKDLFKEEYLLDKSISIIINNFKLESEYYREHYKLIKHNIISSLKEIAEKEKSLFNNIFNEGIQIQESFLKVKNNLINKQKIYNNSLNDFYLFISGYEEKEIITILNSNTSNNIVENDKSFRCATMNQEINKNNLINDETKVNKQVILKKEKLIEKIIESKNEYSSCLDESNNFLTTYNIKIDKILESLEEKYYSLICNIHSNLISTINDRINLVSKLNSLFKNLLENNLNQIDAKNELIEFITRNATKEFPIYKFEFFSNKYNNKKMLIDINKYLNEKIENENIITSQQRRGKSRKKTDIRKYRRRSIKKKNTGDKNENAALLLENDSIIDIKNYKIKSNTSLIEDFIDELINNKFEEEIINIDTTYYNESSNNKMIDISNIKSLLDKRNNDSTTYIENLIKILNGHRAKGNFLLSIKSYNILIDLFNFIFDNFPHSDFILKNLIILAQTFFTYDNNQLNLSSEKKKIFIQNGLKNKTLFNKSEVWHRVINFTLSNNIIIKDISQQVDKNENNNKLKTLIYNTLVAYLCDIKYFTDDENVFNEVKHFYCRIYELDEVAINNEVNGIINFEPIKQRKKGVSFSINFL